MCYVLVVSCVLAIRSEDTRYISINAPTETRDETRSGQELSALSPKFM